MLVNNLKTKTRFWNDIVKFCEMLSSEIGFGQRKLNEIILNYQQICSEECKRILQNYIKRGCGEKIFSRCECLLDLEEEKLLDEFFQTLGETDSYNELIKINNYKIRFVQKYDYYHEKSSKFSPLIFKLSIIFGIVICIVFI